MFALGLALTVAPLTATVLADVDENDAGVITGALRSIAFAGNAHSVRAFHDAILICAALVAVSGAIGAIGIANPRRDVAAATCAGGQFVVVPQASRPQQA